ncbi:hypothetical protein O181_106767 [Austropuccinia psidii MF-1]|uniref:Uncharacterized protein n=1 Tax=Austropuccinia psidii MF-1 TaxID=1389203 RepID=A0A9Q3PNP3_9BASI|nr:hypothetical protein [Austropuccinia psidii MF-1]
MKAPNQALEYNIIKKHKIAQQIPHFQLIINKSFHIPAHHPIFHQVVGFDSFFMESLLMTPFTVFQNIPFLSLKRPKKVLTRTPIKASIDSEISYEQTNPPPQISPQAVPYHFHHNKNNFPIPPTPEVLIPQPAPSISPFIQIRF